MDFKVILICLLLLNTKISLAGEALEVASTQYATASHEDISKPYSPSMINLDDPKKAVITLPKYGKLKAKINGVDLTFSGPGTYNVTYDNQSSSLNIAAKGKFDVATSSVKVSNQTSNRIIYSTPNEKVSYGKGKSYCFFDSNGDGTPRHDFIGESIAKRTKPNGDSLESSEMQNQLPILYDKNELPLSTIGTIYSDYITDYITGDEKQKFMRINMFKRRVINRVKSFEDHLNDYSFNNVEIPNKKEISNIPDGPEPTNISGGSILTSNPTNLDSYSPLKTVGDVFTGSNTTSSNTASLGVTVDYQ